MAQLKKIGRPELVEVLRGHKKMLEQRNGGRRANLSFHDLANEEFSRFDLSMADFSGASLQHAILMETNFTSATLFSTDLRIANLRRANMTRCDLRGACMRGADLTDAILVKADMREGTLAWHENGETFQEYRSSEISAAIAVRADFTSAKMSGSFAAQTVIL